ncbi:unnamed protein product [Schistosoma mattheei]|uniref:Uncharacterized protein n=1 Tax=Schistosoma mattheei TaxID=31246 RepID=A0A3P7XDV3_9TREM|nr:unnamed protein product [Schistosoma mattheei]
MNAIINSCEFCVFSINFVCNNELLIKCITSTPSLYDNFDGNKVDDDVHRGISLLFTAPLKSFDVIPMFNESTEISFELDIAVFSPVTRLVVEMLDDDFVEG